MSKRFFRYFLPLFAAAIIVAVPGGCSWIDMKQREVIFRPVKDDWRGYSGESDQAAIKIAVGENGDHLAAWWMPATAKDAPALLYLHGARWNLTGSSSRIARYRALGFSILAIDYRGFGKSSGDIPSEETAYEDARAAWEQLIKLTPASRHYLYGHSLGGAIAIDLARDNKQVDGLILESTFTSIRDLAKTFSWGWLPLELVLTQRFDSLDKIAGVEAPTLIVHGREDRLVPVAMGEQLYAASKAPKKKLLLVDGAGHSNIAWSNSFDNVRLAVHAFFGIGAGAASSSASEASTR